MISNFFKHLHMVNKHKYLVFKLSLKASIPLRGLLEEMGAKIAWNGECDEITLDAPPYEIKLQIQNELVYVKDPLYGNIMYTLINPPIIKDSRTFVPIRFISEILGYKVSWDGETQTVLIEK